MTASGSKAEAIGCRGLSLRREACTRAAVPQRT